MILRMSVVPMCGVGWYRTLWFPVFSRATSKTTQPYSFPHISKFSGHPDILLALRKPDTLSLRYSSVAHGGASGHGT